ncbi:hypothetical protein [Legionella sp. W05-934-2]|jgi:hypothetical protein|uniref:hypothetical protein n=1 Tax=Legionella sp. W05-934-2 TaxID=1198649 RepID=UPI00346273F4
MIVQAMAAMRLVLLKINNNTGNIAKFQTLVEEFILLCCNSFHLTENHFQDIALSLIDRGDDARVPYDFYNYPLGKCGKAPFSATKNINDHHIRAL